VEGTVNKVRRQLVELQSTAAPEDRADVWVEGQTPEGYLQRFAWNEAKYPSRRPLKEIVASIMETVQKLDDDLKVGAGCWVLCNLGGDGGRHERQVFPTTAD
jgi:V-type H+-transporting ATPase subunit C